MISATKLANAHTARATWEYSQRLRNFVQSSGGFLSRSVRSGTQRAQAGARSVQLHVFNPKLIDRVRNDPIHSLHADESDPNPLERYS